MTAAPKRLPRKSGRARRAEDAIIAAAIQIGCRVAVPCDRCGQWLTEPRSVAARRGPQCRRRV
ncbi:DUF6011 domain-containing protein [Mycobacterium bourgelatii]|uniref:DUF6011 domain-containing protein n=1 Tax=Mycobacterium bourgelatii TaxID=1273442 RepID=UPI0035315064